MQVKLLLMCLCEW